MGREIAISEKGQIQLRLGLVQISVALDESNRSEIFRMCASSNMAAYAIEMTKLEVNGNLVTLQPRSSKFFSENKDFIIKYEVNESSMNSLSFIVFQYYLIGDMDVAYDTITNALFNAEIETLHLHCIFIEDALIKQVKVKGNGSCLYWSNASHIMSSCLDNVWTGRIPPGKKCGIKLAT